MFSTKYPDDAAVHVAFPVESAYFPRAQSVQLVALVDATDFPRGQSSQTELSAFELYFPAEHAVHEFAPIKLMVPAAHPEHTDGLGLWEYLPARQEVQEVDPVTLAYVPAAQSVHAADPSVEVVPEVGGYVMGRLRRTFDDLGCTCSTIIAARLSHNAGILPGCTILTRGCLRSGVFVTQESVGTGQMNIKIDVNHSPLYQKSSLRDMPYKKRHRRC